MKNTIWLVLYIVERAKSAMWVATAKSSALFISLLKHLKLTYRRDKPITLIVDNYIIHKSRETQRWLKENPKFRVIYQPVYSPWVNHVERL
ncbi:transposase [Escherichia coli]|uniref:transposase n=1 Tax=Escherichia coli TaxID=562 RepID=UPI00200B6C2A|nr:transposase [Escherichia coli]